MPIRQLQLGKKGLTKEFLETLKKHFEKAKMLKISVLKSCCRDKQELKKIEKNLLKNLGENYRSRIVGYTINIKKSSKKS